MSPDRLAQPWGARTPYGKGAEWPGRVRARMRIVDLREGVVFLPFHYGYRDAPGRDHDRAANELTLTTWDPASKQPAFKTGAAALRPAGPGGGPPPGRG